MVRSTQISGAACCAGKIAALEVILVFLVGASCSKTEQVKCGDGTVLKDGTCVVAAVPTASVPAAQPKPPPKKASLSCADACKKNATCKGLNVEAPLVVAGCTNLCKEVEGAADDVREAFLACMEKADCSAAGRCGEEFAKATAPKMRDAKDSDAVVVLKQSVSAGEYGIGRNLSVSYKNTTDNVVDGIKFVYFCFNNFDDPVGNGRLISQDLIKGQGSDRGIWKIYEDTCTKVKVTVTEVHFKDGTKWVAE